MQETALRIGLSARLMHQPPAELGFPGKVLQYLEQSIAHWIMGHGALAFMIPTIGSTGTVERHEISVADYVASLDGLVLQGGTDVSPETYGESPLRPEWSGDIIRDRYEIELLWEFVIRGKPVFGICRGAQLVNVACGGTLYQDLPTQIENVGVHRDDLLYDRLNHEIDLLPDSRLAQLYRGSGPVRVNSIHHQAIRNLGNDLSVEARSSVDGVVEAVRWQGSSYMAGVQWHPEFHAAGAGLLDSTPIMEEFLRAARAARRARD
ncbi:MAG: type 1 glutamine amidotransferase [Zoogloea sp.]|nr:type 1 glutamine amidotransferase [Zoogloea sp.]